MTDELTPLTPEEIDAAIRLFETLPFPAARGETHLRVLLQLRTQAAELERLRTALDAIHPYKHIDNDPTIEALLDKMKLAHQFEKERDAARALAVRLAAALEAGVVMKNQRGEPCWCRTVAGLYCVGQPQCKAATAALAAAREAGVKGE
jgi:hypothetical protein